MEDNSNATRHTLQYAGNTEDVEKIRELADKFVERKKSITGIR